MLKYLRIQNFAIIDTVEVEFGAGLNIISGETGAGKSIIMDALFLILGGRASSDLIRKGASEASVEALFEIKGSADLQNVLEENGIELNDNELIVRRIVQSSGKNRIFLNGALMNTNTLSSITSRLVDLCGQHDQQLLTHPEEQLLWIDRFGGLEELRGKLSSSHEKWREKKKILDSLATDSTARTQRIDFLKFQINELEEASILSPLEDLQIEQELKVLSSAEALYSFAQEAESAIYGSDATEADPMLDKVGSLLNKARGLAVTDPKLAPAEEILTSLKVSMEEMGHFLRGYSQKLSRDESRLETLNSRLALLTKLKRKYGPALEDVLINFGNFQKELHSLENHDSSLKQAEDEMETAKHELDKLCEEISKKRAKVAKSFSAQVEKELHELNMDRARFSAELSKLEMPQASGFDAVRFLIAPNPGEPMNTLQKIASGGELSRIMLAIHNVISAHGGVGVYLFDEVDSGIGGKTAASVGAKIQKVSHSNQVICITHLPQVAAFADMHFRVEKTIQKKANEERTVCTVIPLNAKDRVLEIARMLSGLENNKEAIANAQAMLAKTKKSASAAPQKLKSNAARNEARI